MWDASENEAHMSASESLARRRDILTEPSFKNKKVTEMHGSWLVEASETPGSQSRFSRDRSALLSLLPRRALAPETPLVTRRKRGGRWPGMLSN